MPRKKKPQKKKKVKSNKGSILSKTEIVTNGGKRKKYSVPTVTPPRHTKERFTNNTSVEISPFEICAYTLPSALEAYERQCRYGVSPSLPLVLHAIKNCLQDTFEREEKNCDLEEEILNKERPFMALSTPDLPRQMMERMRGLTFSLLQQTPPKIFEQIIEYPGMRHILFEMDLLTSSVRDCDSVDELQHQYKVDKSMVHFGFVVMMFCKRLVEMSHNRLSPLAIERLVKLNNCPFHRFCLFPVGEIMKDIYTKNETLKRQFLKFDILPGLFLDLVEIPSLTEQIMDFMFSLEDRDWYNTSQNTLEIAFQRIFIPWIDGHLYSTPENEDNDEDVNAEFESEMEHLLWLTTANQHFFHFIENNTLNNRLFHHLTEVSKSCSEETLNFDKREKIFAAIGEYKAEFGVQTRRY